MAINSAASVVTKRDLVRGRNLRIGAVAAPVVLAAIPLIIFVLLSIVLSGAPLFAVSSAIVGIIATAVGLLTGLGLSGYFLYRYQDWSSEMRERIAANGIGADEIDWFRKELRSSEKRALHKMRSGDLLLEDAYREALASRLTASRIVRSSSKELHAAKRRQSHLKQLKTKNSETFQAQALADAQKIRSINEEAKQLLVESSARLQMIEAAATRGGSLADTEVALKKLASRAEQLPIALQAARIHDEAVAELEAEGKLDVLETEGVEESEIS